MSRLHLSKTPSDSTSGSVSTNQEDFPFIIDRLHQRPAWRTVMLMLGLTIFGLSIYYVVKNLLDNMQEVAELQMRLSPWPIALSFAITLLCVFLAATAWHFILKGFGATIRWRTCSSIYPIAAIGRYLPGYIWRHLSMAYLTEQEGVRLRTVSLAMLWEFVQIEATRVALALTTVSPILIPAFPENRLQSSHLWCGRIAFWAALLSSPLLLTPFLQWKTQYVKRHSDNTPHKGYLWLGMALHLMGNLLYGIGFAVLLTAVQPIGSHQFAAAIFSTSFSWLLSLLAFFVPGGLGVRESIMIYILSNVFPQPVAIAGTLMSRAILLLAELCGALIGLYMWHRKSLCQ